MITQLGRKLIELQELGKLDSSILNAQDYQDINQFLDELVTKNKMLLAWKKQNREVTSAELDQLTQFYTGITTSLSNRFPVKKYIPDKYRLGYATYTNFWQDPFAIILDRQIVLSKFVSTKSVWNQSLKLRYETLKRGDTYSANEVDLQTQPTLVSQLEKQLSHTYNLNRSKEAILNETATLNRLVEMLEIQFQNFETQVREYSHIPWADRVELISISQALKKTLLAKVSELQTSSKVQKNFELEARVHATVRESLYQMVRILQKLDYSALRAAKSEILPSIGSHLMSLVVDSLGETFQIANIKMFDKNLPGLYKVNAAKLKILEQGLQTSETPRLWKKLSTIVQKYGNNIGVCSAITKKCLDNDFVQQMVSYDLVDKSIGNQDQLKVYNPINEQMLTLVGKLKACKFLLKGK